MNVKSVRKKTDNFCVWPFYNHFRPFLCLLHLYLSRNLDADNHFEGLNVSKSQLDQNYDISYKFFLQVCFSILEEKKWKFMFQKWLFFDHLWSFLRQLHRYF